MARTSRRSLVKTAFGAALGGALAGVGLRETRAAVLRTLGEICRKNGDCASNLCLPKDRTGRQRCGCVTPADCPAPPDACSVATCSAGVCGAAARDCAAEVTGDQCNTVACDPQSGCYTNPLTGTACENDPCLVNETCQAGVCGGGVPGNDGALCGNALICSAGACVSACEDACNDVGYCASTVEGTPFCLPGEGCVFCTGCTSTSQCPSGQVCAGNVYLNGQPYPLNCGAFNTFCVDDVICGGVNAASIGEVGDPPASQVSLD
jgi:hypothetical protein